MYVVIKDIEKIVKTQQVKPIHKIRQRPELLRTFGNGVESKSKSRGYVAHGWFLSCFSQFFWCLHLCLPIIQIHIWRKMQLTNIGIFRDAINSKTFTVHEFNPTSSSIFINWLFWKCSPSQFRRFSSIRLTGAMSTIVMVHHNFLKKKDQNVSKSTFPDSDFCTRINSGQTPWV